MNIDSINLYAEAILRMIGHKVKGRGSTEAGAEATAEFWARKGVEMEGFSHGRWQRVVEIERFICQTDVHHLEASLSR